VWCGKVKKPATYFLAASINPVSPGYLDRTSSSVSGRPVPFLCALRRMSCGHQLLDAHIQEGIGTVREKCESLMTEFRKGLG